MTEETPNKPTGSPKEADATYDHVIKYTGLFGGVQSIMMLVAIVRNKVVSELLGPSGVALINLFNNAIKLISQSTDFGLSFSAVKHVAELSDYGSEAETQDLVRTVRTWCLFTGLFGMLLALLLCRVLSIWTFETEDYTWDFVLLSLSVCLLTIQGGEMAILKGLKKLKRVALISVFGALATFVVSAPIYYFWRMDGVVYSLVLCSIVTLAIHLHHSNKVIPWHVSLFSRDVYAQGLPMVRLGIGFIIAGIFGQGAEYVIRTLILHFGDLVAVGLYTSGYTLAVSYSNLIFVAFEADYFPRLSATQHDLRRMNQTVNQQIEVGVLLVTPMLTLFVLAMPILVPLLFSAKFVNAIPMAICATFYVFFRAFTLPVSYLALAKSDSRMYMLTELVYDIFIALAIPYAYKYWGLSGAGWALSVAGLLDMLSIHALYAIKYHFRLDVSQLRLYLMQLLCFSVAVFASLQADLWMKAVAAIAMVASVIISIIVMRSRTHIISNLKKRLWRK